MKQAKADSATTASMLPHTESPVVTAAPEGIVGIHHFNFTVEDLDHTVDFYTRLLGFHVRSRAAYHIDSAIQEDVFGESKREEIAREGIDYEVATLELNGVRIEFMWFSRPKSAPYPGDMSVAGSAHMAIRVKDIEEVRKRLEASGVVFSNEISLFDAPGSRPWYFCSFQDPNGIYIELIQEQPVTALLETLGLRVREARSARGLTLKQVASLSDISTAHLSQIERGDAIPSLPVLVAISASLGFAPEFFVRPEDSSFADMGMASDGHGLGLQKPVQQALAEKAYVLTPDSRQSLTATGKVEWTWLTGPGEPIRVVEARYAVGAGSEDLGLNQRGVELGIVLEGTLQVELGSQSQVLSAGSSIRYDRSVTRRFSNVGEVPAALITITTGYPSAASA